MGKDKELTHYEDLHYHGEGSFTDAYEAFLKNPENMYDPYKDPDTAGKESIYERLIKFLNQQIKEKRKKGWEFTNGWKFTKSCNGKIQLIRQNGEDLYLTCLTSDQFGFSRPEWNKKKGEWEKSKYPYAILLNSDENEDGEIEEIRKLVTDCIYETRTLGGSFLWPTVYLENHKDRYGKDAPGHYSLYNYYRGAYGYIQDRVDLTLNEIKCFFDVYKRKTKFCDFIKLYREKYKDNILFIYPNGRGRPLYTKEEKEIEMQAMFEWLSLFGTFEKYVEFFCFENFVMKNSEGKCVPIDITQSVISDDKSESLKPLKFKLCEDSQHKYLILDRGFICGLEELDKEELGNKKLQQTVHNVRNLILRRSTTMECLVSEANE